MPGREALDDHEAVVGERGVQRRAELGLRPHLRDADRGAEPGGLDEHRRAEHGQLAQHGLGLGRQRASPHARVGHLRDVGGGEHLFEDDLVHAQRGREHARADVGHVEQLQQALERAVLAERAVQDREHGVGAEQPAAGPQRQLRRRSWSTSPPRSIVTGSTSWPAAATPSRTAAAEFSETSCSDERPPARTATLIGVGVGVGGRRRGRRRRRAAGADGRSSPCRRSSAACRPPATGRITRPTRFGIGSRPGRAVLHLVAGLLERRAWPLRSVGLLGRHVWHLGPLLGHGRA